MERKTASGLFTAQLTSAMRKGFTLVELSVVIFIIVVLLSIVYLDVINSQRKTSLTSSSTVLISDLKSQQIKAMEGENGGATVASPSGIYFNGNTYTLFSGITYGANDINNFAVNLDSNVQLISSFSGSIINFASGSGEISNFTTGADTITIKNSFSGDKKVIKLNKYGAVTSVN